MKITQGANPTQNGKISIHGQPGNPDSVVYVAVADETGRTATAAGGFLVSAELASVGYSVNGGGFVQMDLPENPEPQTFQVAGATNTSPITITTTTPNGLQNGDRVQVTGVQGNLGANAIFSIANATGNSFDLVGSVGTGIYAGGGTVAQLTGINSRGNALSGLSLEADPMNPNVVYIGGDFQDSSGSAGAAIQRGDRSAPRAGGNLVPSPQWTQITGVNAGNTAPKSGTRDFVVDAFGRLVVATAGGVFARASGLDNASPWTSANGNLALAEMISIGYDPLNNVLFGSTNELGTVSQVSGAGAAGSNFWTTQRGETRIAEAENATIPNQTVRYTSTSRLRGTQRQIYDAANNLLQTQQVGFLDTATGLPALQGADADNSDDQLGRSFFKLNAVDPRLVLAGRNAVYEDDNPAGSAGDRVAVVTPAGFVGRLSAVVYGGRVAGVNATRVAYLGTDSGQLFARGQQDGFQLVPLPGTGGVTAVAVDPDDFRRVYAVRNQSAVYFSSNGGQTWTDITQNLFTSTLDAQGNPVLFATDPATGQATGGLTTAISDIAVYDPTPGGAGGGGTTLIAAGRGGVFRFNPPGGVTGATNPVPGFGWTEFGVGLPNADVSSVRVFGNRLVAADARPRGLRHPGHFRLNQHGRDRPRRRHRRQRHAHALGRPDQPEQRHRRRRPRLDADHRPEQQPHGANARPRRRGHDPDPRHGAAGRRPVGAQDFDPGRCGQQPWRPARDPRRPPRDRRHGLGHREQDRRGRERHLLRQVPRRGADLQRPRQRRYTRPRPGRGRPGRQRDQRPVHRGREHLRPRRLRPRCVSRSAASPG